MENNKLVQAAEAYAEKHGFRIPYDGSNKFYDDVDVKASLEGFDAGAEFIIEQIEDFINIHTCNAHDMSNDNPKKPYYQGKDDAYCEILNLLREINDGK